MSAGRPNGFGAGWIGAAALCAACVLAATALVPPTAQGGPEEPGDGPPGTPPGRLAGTWFSIGLLTGSTQFDAGLADYQWDTTPSFGWGVRGLAGRGRFAAGLELWRAGTTQSIGDLGAAPRVSATSLELVGEARIVGDRGTHLVASGHGGRLRIAYDPDRVTIQPPGPVAPIAVALEPVDAWIGGAGLALRRSVATGWRLGIGVDARLFAIETAHRSGTSIVIDRESFGDWSARCEIARTFGR